MMTSLHRLSVWDKTGGRCAYCGMKLHPDAVRSYSGQNQSWMEIDHLTPQKDGGDTALSNLAPSCSSCNASKGAKSLEAFRYLMAKKASGRPHISREALDWMESVGVQLPDLPPYEFWFEKDGFASAHDVPRPEPSDARETAQ